MHKLYESVVVLTSYEKPVITFPVSLPLQLVGAGVCTLIDNNTRKPLKASEIEKLLNKIDSIESEDTLEIAKSKSSQSATAQFQKRVLKDNTDNPMITLDQVESKVKQIQAKKY